METPTAEDIIGEVRSIAEALAIRDVKPGFISGSTEYRARDLLIRAGIPLGPWAEHRQYLTKPGTANVNDQPVAMEVHKATVDDTAGEICRAIVSHLMLVNWRIHPEYRDWTPETAEAAICKAAEQLPKLCDWLELVSGMTPKHVGTVSGQAQPQKIIVPTNEDVSRVCNLVAEGMAVQTAAKKVAENSVHSFSTLKTMYYKWLRHQKNE